MSFNREKVKAIMILDVIGRPPEHLVETLKNIVNEIEKEKGVHVKTNNVKEPTLIKEQKDFYTTFAELEFEVDELLYLIVLMFKYMPAHIEIIKPENLSLDAATWNDILNELIRRLHTYDELARIAQIENAKLAEQIKQVTGQNVQTLTTIPISVSEQKQSEKANKIPKESKQLSQKKKSGQRSDVVQKKK